MSTPDGMWVHLKDYVDQRFHDQGLRIDDVRQITREVEAAFLPRVQYDAQHHALEEAVADLEDRMNQANDRISSLQGRAIALAGLVSLIAATVSAVVTAIVVHLVSK